MFGGFRKCCTNHHIKPSGTNSTATDQKCYNTSSLFISTWIHASHAYLFSTSGYSSRLVHAFCYSAMTHSATGRFFSRLPWHSDTPPFVCFCLLLSGNARWWKLIWHISCPSPRINHFSKEPWFLLWTNGIRIQDLGTRYAHCWASQGPW